MYPTSAPSPLSTSLFTSSYKPTNKFMYHNGHKNDLQKKEDKGKKKTTRRRKTKNNNNKNNNNKNKDNKNVVRRLQTREYK